MRRMHGGGVTALVLTAAVLALPSSASASLGQDIASVQIDQARMKGSLQVVKAAGHTVHEIRVPGGTRVREYVSPGGVVFAITWQGAFRPDLEQLLGNYFDAFREAAQAARMQHAGRGPLVIERPELVVTLGGHQRAFFGRAYVPGLLPPTVTVQDIR